MFCFFEFFQNYEFSIPATDTFSYYIITRARTPALICFPTVFFNVYIAQLIVA